MLRDKINNERIKHKITVYQLSKDSGLQRTQLMRYLKCETDLKGENIDKLLKVLNINFKN
jgi:transcriptional regulator with XRE-family HTH domain